MPDKFTLDIAIGNDAMLTLDDIADALRDVAAKLDYGTDGSGIVRDANGNTVGRFELKGE